MRVNSINTVIPNIQNKRTQISFMSNKPEATLVTQAPDSTEFKRNFAKAVNPNVAEEGRFIKRAWKAFLNFFNSGSEDFSNMSFEQIASITASRL